MPYVSVGNENSGRALKLSRSARRSGGRYCAAVGAVVGRVVDGLTVVESGTHLSASMILIFCSRVITLLSTRRESSVLSFAQIRR